MAYYIALKAIMDMYSDTSVSQEETLKRLNSLKDEIDILAEALGI